MIPCHIILLSIVIPCRTNFIRKGHPVERHIPSSQVWECPPPPGLEGLQPPSPMTPSLGFATDLMCKFSYLGTVCTQKCPDNVDEYCGTGGETFKNLCQLNVAKCLGRGTLGLKHKGACLPNEALVL